MHRQFRQLERFAREIRVGFAEQRQVEQPFAGIVDDVEIDGRWAAHAGADPGIFREGGGGARGPAPAFPAGPARPRRADGVIPAAFAGADDAGGERPLRPSPPAWTSGDGAGSGADHRRLHPGADDVSPGLGRSAFRTAAGPRGAGTRRSVFGEYPAASDPRGSAVRAVHCDRPSGSRARCGLSQADDDPGNRRSARRGAGPNPVVAGDAAGRVVPGEQEADGERSESERLLCGVDAGSGGLRGHRRLLVVN